MQTISIPYSFFLGDSCFVEVAALPRTRIVSSAVLSLLATGGLLCSGDLASHEPIFHRYLREAGWKKEWSSREAKTYSNGDLRIHVVDGKRLPVSQSYKIVVVAAERVDPAILKTLQRMSDVFICVSGPVEQGTWLHEQERIKIPASEVVRRFPDQAAFILPQDDLDYARLMELRDPPPVSARTFIRRRCHVRTDKPVSLLSPLQQRIAAPQAALGVTPVVPMELTALQRRYLAMKRKSEKKWFLLLKYRRGGFTTLEQSLNYAQVCRNPRSYVAALAETREKTARIFRIAKLMHEEDPKAPALVGESKSQLELANGSLYFIGTAGSSSFARGDTLQRVHGSEVAKWCDGNVERIEEVMAGVYGAVEHGELVLETTPNGEGWFKNAWDTAMRGGNEFEPLFLAWFHDPINRVPGAIIDPDDYSDRERFLVAEHGLDCEQIAFRRDRIRKFGVLFPQEYPEDPVSCFLASGTCYFDLARLADLRDRAKTPIETRRLEGDFTLNVYQHPEPGVRYYAGTDTSEGLRGCDNNGTVIVNLEGEDVAEIYGCGSIGAQAKFGAELCERYNRAYWGIERNNTSGGAVITKVQELGYRRLFYFSGDRAGWSTDASTRPIGLNRLRDYVDVGVVNSANFLREAPDFRLQSDGKYRSSNGAHDDAVMMRMIANEMRERGPRGSGIHVY